MISRYTTPEIAAIWSDDSRLKFFFDVEVAALEATEKLALWPSRLESIKQKAKAIDWHKLATRAQEIEKTTQHDVIAFLTALEEVLGDDSRFLHFGLTSSDIVDTAFALQLKKALQQILTRLSVLIDALWAKANEHRDVICLGRTHGQAAEITTFGLKLLSYVAEMARHKMRLGLAVQEISFGKLSGAVGNYGQLSPQVEADALALLGLNPEIVATQVIPRDRHAVVFARLAVLAGGLERLAVEIRHLMRNEVAEAFEPFGKGQKGSSAMPHKKNPILSENITGLARLVRNFAGAAFENQALWHERDISHSSVERVIAPDATNLIDFALKRMTQVVEGLEIDANKMAQHVEATKGLIFSESVLLALVKKGLLRQEAYLLVQRAAFETKKTGKKFADSLSEDKEIAQILNAKEIAEIFDAKKHLGHVQYLFDRVEMFLR